MKKLIKITLAVLMCMSFVACSSTDENKGTEQTGPVEVTLWHTYTEHHNDFLNEMIDEFNASQSEVKVIAVQQPYQDYDANLIQAVRNGVGPDICSRFATNIADYIEDDLLVDFAPYINDSEIGIPNFKENLSGDLYGELTQWGEGAIYGIPNIVTSEVLYYNKTLFEELNLEVPKTWEELENVSRVIYEKTGKPGFGTDSAIDTFQGLLVQNGSGYIDASTKSMVIDEDVALEQLTWLADCIQEGIFRLPGDDYYLSGPFTSGAVASYIGSSAGVGYATQNDGAFEVGAAPIPQADENHPYISSWGGAYVCFKSTSEKEEAAYKFLKWFTSTDNAAEWAIHFGAIPAYKDAMETEEFQAYKDTNIAVNALYEEYNAVNWLNSINGSASVRTAIDKMISEVCLTGADAKTAYDTMIQTANAELNQ